MHARILALDVGQRRIGLAISDALGITAQGLPTLERTHDAADRAALTRIARERGAARLLVGLPIHLSGREGTQAAVVRRFGDALARHSGLPVVYRDERLTTVEAGRVLREAGAGLARRRKAVDRLAAVILLQSHLDAGEGG